MVCAQCEDRFVPCLFCLGSKLASKSRATLLSSGEAMLRIWELSGRKCGLTVRKSSRSAGRRK